MKFVIRKVGTTWFLACGSGKGKGKTLIEWTTVAKATRFEDYGSAAIRAQKLGLEATAIMVEAVPQ